ncbi:hypothetical protein AB834_02105 [PVC group bacterium (ex Bugula neritina AB1)]|nr:hypothetical protein AB834_02105 [PVC group bacterium (ex Bugula neritina AB1)]
MDNSDLDVRFDTWLHAVRIFKTRKIANDACKRGHVKVQGNSVKPFRKVTVGLEIEVKKEGLWRNFLVLGLLEKRVAYKIAVDYVKETTPTETLEKYKAIKSVKLPRRERGSGRPTKKERREIDKVSPSF